MFFEAIVDDTRYTTTHDGHPTITIAHNEPMANSALEARIRTPSHYMRRSRTFFQKGPNSDKLLLCLVGEERGDPNTLKAGNHRRNAI